MKIRDYFKINPSKNSNKYTDFINYIDTGAVSEGHLIGVSYLDADFPSRAQRLVNVNDILYSSVRPNLRHYYLYKNNYPHVVASTGFVLLRNTSKYNTQFAYYFLTTKEVVKHLSNIAELSQSTFPSFSSKDLGKIDLPDIDSKEQEKIVSILSNYDNLIEVNNKRIKVLEQMAENLYKEWFIRFRFPGHETAEFENGIPKGWEYCTVETLSDVLQRGISPEYDDDGLLAVISQKCIRQNIMDIKEARKQNKSFKPELNLQDGDTVICSTGTGTLGRVGQVYGDYPDTTFDSHVTLIRAKSDIGKHFLYWTLKELQPWFMNMGIGSTNQQELYRGTIKNAKVLKPENGIIEQFEKMVEPLHKRIINLIWSRENQIRQRDLLLPRLMSGKLEV
jgi:type I restriction enzyme S subunit